jgi:hypothetical protein
MIDEVLARSEHLCADPDFMTWFMDNAPPDIPWECAFCGVSYFWSDHSDDGSAAIVGSWIND